MVGPLTISVGLGLATLTDSHMLCDSDTHNSPKAQYPAIKSQGYNYASFGCKASTHTVVS